MDIIGKKFGYYTIVEECDDRSKKGMQVIVECDCGTRRKYCKSIFLHGVYPEKCFKCHLKEQKSKYIKVG